MGAFAPAASAQELEPRAYSQSPVGVNFLIFSYARQSGDVLFDPTLPFNDVEVGINSTILSYGRTFGLAGRQASAVASVPYAWGEVSGEVFGEQRQITRSGLGDARLRFSMNLVGGPALGPRQFAARKPTRTLGASLTVVAPTGQYDPARLINLGANRWAFKPELGVSQPVGRWHLELYGGVWLFTDNKNFFGGARREQRPLASLQTHVSYTFRPRLWLAGNANFYTGGRTEVNGALGADLQRNSRVGVTLSLPAGRRESVKVAWASGLTTRSGGDFNTVVVGWQHTWFD